MIFGQKTEAAPEQPPIKYSDRKAEIMKMIEPYKGQGMMASWDENSVTFKRGVHAESVNFSTSDAIIERIIKRIATAATYVPNKRKEV